MCKGLYKTLQSLFIYPVPLEVHVFRLETTKPVPFESLSLPLCIQRANAAVAVSVAVVVYTLLPNGVLLVVVVNTAARTVIRTNKR